MMKKIGRNDPCPCGSGSKYKRCCLGRDEGAARECSVAEGAVSKALDWLMEHHGEEVGDAIEFQYGAGLGPEQLGELEALRDDLLQMFQLNAFEWVLCEGRQSPEDDQELPPRFADLVLGPGGPLMEVDERRYLETLTASPLGLYEVVEVQPTRGFWLVSALAEEREKFWVQEGSASRTLKEGDIFAGRVLPNEPRILSGCLYPFGRLQYLELRGRILEGPRDSEGNIEPAWISRCVIEKWLSVLIGPAPRIVDAASGDPILLTTVHYRVKNWASLEEALKGQSDVRKDGDDSWVRLDDPEASLSRVLHSLRRGKEDRLEIFSRTAARAETGDKWVAEIAGDSVEKITREISDPRHLWKTRHQSETAPTRSEDPLEGLSKTERSEFQQRLYRRIYENWADEPIPALRGKTPRQAIRSPQSRREVAELLRSYEVEERRQSAGAGRDPVDFSFLWEEVGLPPDELAP